jgi:hypothetical protein
LTCDSISPDTVEDIFDLQDDITLKVVGAIAPKLENAEIDRAMRKPTQSLDGYDYYLRAQREVRRTHRFRRCAL